MIVHEGRTRASIIVPKDAPVEVVRAAKELQTYLKKTSGAELPIRNEGAGGKDRVEIRIAVNPLGIVRGGDPATQIVHEDGYAIQSGGRMITIMGGSPRGTLYGVYDFIERALGVRWFMPTELGEDILKAKSIAVPELTVVRNPAFPSVSGFTWAGSPGAADWELRMRVKVGKPVNFGHNWYNIHRFSKEALEKDPEMFALVGGQRGLSTQLCSSHPKVIQASVEAARRYFKANPDSPLFSISPNDGAGWCECERCKNIDALYGITDFSLADRFVHYANRVLEELEKTNPGKQVGIYAYSEHTSPPKRARPKEGYVTALTHMPWEFCHIHAIDDPACPSNQRYLGYLKGWSNLTRHVGVYEYYGHFFAFTPWPIVHSMRRDIPLYRDMKIERFISETQQNWANQGLNFYVAAKLVADPTVDVDALLAEYFTRFYGKAGGAMRRYSDLWETAIKKTGESPEHRGYWWLSMFSLRSGRRGRRDPQGGGGSGQRRHRPGAQAGGVRAHRLRLHRRLRSNDRCRRAQGQGRPHAVVGRGAEAAEGHRTLGASGLLRLARHRPDEVHDAHPRDRSAALDSAQARALRASGYHSLIVLKTVSRSTGRRPASRIRRQSSSTESD